jgi:hypothetical protein
MCIIYSFNFMKMVMLCVVVVIIVEQWRGAIAPKSEMEASKLLVLS